MMRTNKVATYNGPKTFEGAIASKISAKEQLIRTVMSCMLFEKNFYEDGEEVATRIKRLTKEVGQDANQILLDAKFKQNLRHAPLWMVVAMIEAKTITKEMIASICTRADDMTELLAMYFADGKKPLAKVLQKGLALAFKKFDAYQLAKYDRDNAVKLRDVLRLVRPIPENEVQSALWKGVIDRNLPTPDTWETELSAGKDKKETFERLIIDGKLGDLAFIRNLRGMIEAKVEIKILRNSFADRSWKKMLPFQFVTAARYAPSLEPELEGAMLKALSFENKIVGDVAILVDGSGSMSGVLSAKGEATRFDVACGVAIMAREICETPSIFRFNDYLNEMPPRHGFALRDVLGGPSGGTQLGGALRVLGQKKWSLIIVITDEQSSDQVSIKSANSDLVVIVNVGTSDRGVGYGKGSLHISGWSDSVIEYIREYYGSSHE